MQQRRSDGPSHAAHAAQRGARAHAGPVQAAAAAAGGSGDEDVSLFTYLAELSLLPLTAGEEAAEAASAGPWAGARGSQLSSTGIGATYSSCSGGGGGAAGDGDQRSAFPAVGKQAHAWQSPWDRSGAVATGPWGSRRAAKGGSGRGATPGGTLPPHPNIKLVSESSDVASDNGLALGVQQLQTSPIEHQGLLDWQQVPPAFATVGTGAGVTGMGSALGFAAPCATLDQALRFSPACVLPPLQQRLLLLQLLHAMHHAHAHGRCLGPEVWRCEGVELSGACWATLRLPAGSLGQPSAQLPSSFSRQERQLQQAAQGANNVCNGAIGGRGTDTACVVALDDPAANRTAHTPNAANDTGAGGVPAVSAGGDDAAGDCAVGSRQQAAASSPVTALAPDSRQRAVCWWREAQRLLQQHELPTLTAMWQARQVSVRGRRMEGEGRKEQGLREREARVEGTISGSGTRAAAEATSLPCFRRARCSWEEAKRRERGKGGRGL